MLRRWWRHLAWRRLPLWAQTYIVGWLALSTALATVVAMAAIAGVARPALAQSLAQSTPQAVESWLGRNAIALLGYVVTFGASVWVGLWRLGRLEQEAVTRDQLATHLTIAAGERTRLTDSVSALNADLAAHVKRMDVALEHIDRRMEVNAKALQQLLLALARDGKDITP